jgi:hypothetical protein
MSLSFPIKMHGINYTVYHCSELHFPGIAYETRDTVLAAKIFLMKLNPIIKKIQTFNHLTGVLLHFATTTEVTGPWDHRRRREVAPSVCRLAPIDARSTSRSRWMHSCCSWRNVVSESLKNVRSRNRRLLTRYLVARCCIYTRVNYWLIVMGESVFFGVSSRSHVSMQTEFRSNSLMRSRPRVRQSDKQELDRKFFAIRWHFDKMTWASDTLDWCPRHSSGGNLDSHFLTESRRRELVLISFLRIHADLYIAADFAQSNIF